MITASKRKLNPKHLTEAVKDEAVIKYKSGIIMTASANTYGCHRTTVGDILRKKGVAMRE